jgi:hypothetical protein
MISPTPPAAAAGDDATVLRAHLREALPGSAEDPEITEIARRIVAGHLTALGHGDYARAWLESGLAANPAAAGPVVRVADECQHLADHAAPRASRTRQDLRAILELGRAAGVTVLVTRSDPHSRPAPVTEAVLAAGPDLVTMRAALADAAAYRTEHAGAWCVDCSVHPAELCEQHAADLDAAGAYEALAAGLGEALTTPECAGGEVW